MDLGMTLSDLPLVVWYILSLVVLEGLLSADNALVLAVMVRHLPVENQRRALRYGLWGAFGFRLIAVLLSSMLIRFWVFKVLGGVYLLYLSAAHFLASGGEGTAAADPDGGSRWRAWRRGFWGTVLAVELADIVFSVDSILAAVGMADSLPSRYGDPGKLAIVYTGGVLGIVTMRFVAGYFILLLNRFSGLASAAYLLVAWIGVKLVAGGLHSGGQIAAEIPPWVFWTVMGAIAVAGFFIRPRAKEIEDVSEEMEMLSEEMEDLSGEVVALSGEIESFAEGDPAVSEERDPECDRDDGRCPAGPGPLNPSPAPSGSHAASGGCGSSRC